MCERGLYSNVLCVQSVYQCCMLSHTVLSKLYQEKLVIEDDVKRMKGQEEDLSVRVVLVQFTKSPEVVARTSIVLDKYRHNEEAVASLLRGW